MPRPRGRTWRVFPWRGVTRVGFWLMAHELRLAWRGSGKSNRKLLIALLAAGFVTIAGFAGVPLALVLGHWTPELTPALALGLDTALLLILSLMLSQTISQAVEVFYARRDLDLLLSSPLPGWRVLTVRCLALSVTTSATYLALISPVVLTVAAFGHLRWVAVYPLLLALGLLATTLGLLMAMALFRLIGPQRTRTTAQLLAAFVARLFSSPRGSTLPATTRRRYARLITAGSSAGSIRARRWPARAPRVGELGWRSACWLAPGVFRRGGGGVRAAALSPPRRRGGRDASAAAPSPVAAPSAASAAARRGRSSARS